MSRDFEAENIWKEVKINASFTFDWLLHQICLEDQIRLYCFPTSSINKKLSVVCAYGVKCDAYKKDEPLMALWWQV